ncbi:MAG: hypothetical protein HFE58_06590 [Firmicutes bacterium]|nr:hypothetical protein [Bacillota bacterium]
MEKGVLQIIKEMVIKTITEQFEQSEVYGEEVPQKGNKNCFGVTVKSVEQKPLLKGRREQWITINVEYRNDEEKRAKTESTKKAEILYDVLSLIGEGKDKFFAVKMQHKMTEKGFQFEVVYYVQIIPVVTERKMKRLEHNGSKVVGY